MWPYWFFLFLMPAIFSIWFDKKIESEKKYSSRILWNLTLVIFILVIGLRHQIVVDWYTYIYLFDITHVMPLNKALQVSDPAYDLLSWIMGNIDLDIHSVNFICGIFFVICLFNFCKKQLNQWLALITAVPYLVVVVSMNYTRQAVAIGFLMVALISILNRQNIKFLALVLVASLFHKTALSFLALFVLYDIKNIKHKIKWLLFLCIILFFFENKFNSLLNSYIYTYIYTEYNSSGALVRILMNVLPAVIFLIYKNNFQLQVQEIKIWTAIAYCCIFLLFLFFISPSSTAIDRINLYLMPIQIFFYSSLPYILNINDKEKIYLKFLLVILNAFILYIWLNYAVNSYAWKDYNFSF